MCSTLTCVRSGRRSAQKAPLHVQTTTQLIRRIHDEPRGTRWFDRGGGQTCGSISHAQHQGEFLAFLQRLRGSLADRDLVDVGAIGTVCVVHDQFLVSETCRRAWWCEGGELPRVLHDNLEARVLELLQVLRILAVAMHSVPVPRQAQSERERTATNRPKRNGEQTRQTVCATQGTCTP